MRSLRRTANAAKCAAWAPRAAARKVGIALELVAGVLVDRLEHREALALAALDRPQQALVDERAEPVDDVHAGQRVDAGADLLDILDPAPTGTPRGP